MKDTPRCVFRTILQCEVMADIPYTVIRSAKRTRTVQARMENGVAVIRIPARMSKAQESEVVAEMLAKLQRKSARNPRSDEQLACRAEELNQQVLDGRARIGSIRWVDNQTTRWGSCTVATGDIRLSSRLISAPTYVIDAVIIHELTHTFISGHTKEFWAWADRAPHAERAKGYLEALQRFV